MRHKINYDGYLWSFGYSSVKTMKNGNTSLGLLVWCNNFQLTENLNQHGTPKFNNRTFRAKFLVKKYNF